MATFSANVYDVLSSLIEEHAFIPCRAVSDKRFASLLRKETDEVYSYVFVRDGRASGVNLDVHFWIAPPESPDDSLDSLGIGYKILVASTFDVDDQFFANAQERIVRLLPAVDPLIAVVVKELKAPVFKTRRWDIYEQEQRLFKRVLDLNRAKDTTAVAAMTSIRRAASKKGKLDQLAEIFVPLAQKFVDGAVLGSKSEEVPDNDVHSLASTLSIHAYVWSLGHLSREGRP